MWYKAVYLNIPLTPHAKQSLFTISAEISFKGDNQSAQISMALPGPQKDMRIISRESESGGLWLYDFSE
ncbi:MAG: UUP1 family membrane protein [Sulfurimonas sp.]